MCENSMRVALYARVSSDQQARDHTIASQLEALRARIQADGSVLDEGLSFIDDGCSGSHLVRPALERLRDYAAAGAFDRLYVLCPDRLARDYAHQMLLVEELQRCGVGLVFVNFPLDETPEGRLMLQAQAMVAEYERAKILERSRRGKRHAAQAGRVSVLGHAPYGYRYLTKHEGDGEARYQVVLEQARVVQQMFQWVGLEGCSLREVARRLMAARVPSPAGLPHWNPNTIGEKLQDRTYLGTAHFGKSRNGPPRVALRPRRGAPAVPKYPRNRIKTEPHERIPIAVPALVDAELFELVGQRLARNKARHGRPARRDIGLLRGLVVCRRCGLAYYVKASGQRKPAGATAAPLHFYYRCAGRDRSRFGGEAVCDGPMLRLERLDAAVWEDVRALLLEPARVEQEYARRLGQLREGPSVSARATQQRIGDVKRRIARLLEMYEDGYLEREEFRRRMEAARARLVHLEEEARAEQDREDQIHELRLVIGRLEEFAGRVREGLDEGDASVRRPIIEALIKEVEIGEETIRVVYRVSPGPFVDRPGRGVVPYCQASRRSATRTSRLVRATRGRPGDHDPNSST
jgi:site-specific DNA recombinase